MSAPETGRWSVIVDGATEVRLRSERVGPFSITMSAPVASGEIVVDQERVRVRLELALDRLSASNFLLQRAARSLISRYEGQQLVYDAEGPAGEPWRVSGVARSGTVEVAMELVISPAGQPADPMGVVAIEGGASIPDVDLPPPIGHRDELTFDVDARLGLRAL